MYIREYKKIILGVFICVLAGVFSFYNNPVKTIDSCAINSEHVIYSENCKVGFNENGQIEFIQLKKEKERPILIKYCDIDKLCYENNFLREIIDKKNNNKTEINKRDFNILEVKKPSLTLVYTLTDLKDGAGKLNVEIEPIENNFFGLRLVTDKNQNSINNTYAESQALSIAGKNQIITNNMNNSKLLLDDGNTVLIIDAPINNAFRQITLKEEEPVLCSNKEMVSYFESNFIFYPGKTKPEFNMIVSPKDAKILESFGVKNFINYGILGSIAKSFTNLLNWAVENWGFYGLLFYIAIIYMLQCSVLIPSLISEKNGENLEISFFSILNIILNTVSFYCTTAYAIPYCFKLKDCSFLWIKNIGIPETNSIMNLNGLLPINSFFHLGFLHLTFLYIVYVLDPLNIKSKDEFTQGLLMGLLFFISRSYSVANIIFISLFMMFKQITSAIVSIFKTK